MPVPETDSLVVRLDRRDCTTVFLKNNQAAQPWAMT